MLTEEEFKELGVEERRKYLARQKGIRGREDLMYLLQEIMGYKDGWNYPIGVEEEVHGELVRSLDLPQKKKLYLLPRGSLKTTVITIGGTVQKILRKPDVRILLDSEVLSYSEKILAQIKREMQKDEFVRIYGEMISKEYKETSREFTVTTRQNFSKKEPTVYASGVGTVQVGPHYDYIIADDLHSEKNVQTSEQIDKVISHYRLLLSLLEPDGEMIVVGTRWHFRDLYSYILEEEIGKAGNPDWYVLIEKAIRDDGSLFFPRRLNKEFLDAQRKSQGAYLFSVLYQNSPTSNEDAIFKKENFRYWEGDRFPEQDGKRIFLNLYILIDRAFSSADSADYTGCVLAGVSCSGNIYVLEAERHKFGLNEMLLLIMGWVDKYGAERVRKVGIETINWEEIEPQIRMFMLKKNKFFICERLLPEGKKSKDLRIRSALEARIANKTVFFKKGMVDLEDELIRFPVGTHDDLIDALAYVVPFMTVPGSPATERDDVEYEPAGWFGQTGY